MTQPMPIEPGKTYMVTRRCAGRHRWLSPGTDLNEMFLYLFALGAQRFGLEVHALVVMSTHYHAILTDPLGVVPAFEQWLHSLLARSVNSLRDRTDTFWDGRHGGRQQIVDARALRRALVYVWNNPTEAGLVRSGKEWPGVRTKPHDMLAGVGSHKAMVVRRPETFFSEAGRMAKTVELALTVPEQLMDEEARREAAASAGSQRESEAAQASPDGAAGSALGKGAAGAVSGPGAPRHGEGVGGGGSRGEGERGSAGTGSHTVTPAVAHASRLKRLAGRIVAQCNELVREAEDKVAQRLAEAGRRFVGAWALLRQSPNVRSTKPEKHGAKSIRVPLFLSSSREVLGELLANLAQWRGRYRAARFALAEFLIRTSPRHEPDLGLFEDAEEPQPPVFPWGTYQLRVYLAVPCHPPPE